jgi:uncharacterized protein YcbK (DUF882 family)
MLYNADMKNATYFRPSELACKCCGKVHIDDKLIDLLDAIREKVGEPVYITSGYRCENRNKKVGGAKHSQHVLGKAADIRVKSMSTKQLAKFLEKNFKIGGMGIYPTFVHVDVRQYSSRPIRW